MHFVTGGAFNGKRKWVKETYSIGGADQHWISAYQGDSLAHRMATSNLLVLEGIEVWTRDWIMEYGGKTRELWNQLLEELIQWEKESADRALILIGADITKGIVPMEKEERIWRDITGWVYQDIATKAERVDIIWYGIHHRVK